jgi:hypothetical protein
LKARLDGVSKRLIREQNDRAWLAYSTAALSRAKKLPKLKDLLVRESGPKVVPKRTPEEIESILRGWMASRRH